MRQPQKKSLKPLLLDLTHWCVLACIAWATYAEPSYGPRLLELAGVWIGITNTLMVLLLTLMLFNKEVRDAIHESMQKFSHLRKIHSKVLRVIELAVFAWAGWLWSFGIRIACIFIQEIIIKKPEENLEEPPQARH
ncbi:hypothetical protein JAO85_20650 [Comamonas sp. NyZ500]|uniref:hypothetical protein n=1 Tax=Comamonas sp. NyZ500 TaxID=2795732 RepID=UPI00192CA68F|nr:hypothetical protein [Comamonas sp. NyZ500]MBL5979692.1 hypothetical protein [Comamonas sp. NyZ500]